MSRFMWVLGVLLAAAGVAILFLTLFNNAYLQVRGLQMSSAIDLIIGAVLAIGLAGVIDAVRTAGGYSQSSSDIPEIPIESPPVEVVAETPAVAQEADAPASRQMRFPSFSRKVEAAAAPAAVVAGSETAAAAEKAEEIIAAAFREGSQRFEWVHRGLDGGALWVEVLLTAIPWQGQRILHTTWRDITQRKRAEAALLASETRFRDLAALVFCQYLIDGYNFLSLTRASSVLNCQFALIIFSFLCCSHSAIFCFKVSWFGTRQSKH